MSFGLSNAFLLRQIGKRCILRFSAADAYALVRDMQHGSVAQVELGNEKSFLFSDSIPIHCHFWHRENSQKLQHFASCKTWSLESLGER